MRLQKRIEYGVRTIDQFGDVIDVNHYIRKPEALREVEAETLGAARPGCEVAVAVVVEHETSWGNDAEGVVEREFEVIYSRGDEAALRAGGWIGPVGGVEQIEKVDARGQVAR